MATYKPKIYSFELKKRSGDGSIYEPYTGVIRFGWYATEKTKDWVKGFEVRCKYWYGNGVYDWYSVSDNALTVQTPYTVSDLSRTREIEINFQNFGHYPPTSVYVEVCAVPNTHNVNGKEVPYFAENAWEKYLYQNGSVSSNQAYVHISNLQTPPVPNAPNVEIDEDQMTISLEYSRLNQEHEVQANVIVFNVWEDDSYEFIHEIKVPIVTDYVETKISVRNGHKYKVRAKARLATTGVSKESEWSEWSDRSETRPAQGGALTLRALTSTSIEASWSKVDSARSYEVEWMADENHFDSMEASSMTVTQTTAILTGLETGHKYYVRFRAVNDAGDGAWSGVESITLGRKPGSPTTWSSTTTGIIGRDVILYWVHNALDNSSQVKAELEITVNGVTTTEEIINSTDEFEKDKTSKYTLNTALYPVDSVIRWRVRTMGVTEEYGDWSIMREITMYIQPVLTIRVANGRDWYWDPFDFQNDTIYTAQGAITGDSTIVDRLLIFIEGIATPASQKPISYDISIVSNADYDTLDETGMNAHVMNGQEVYHRQFDIDTKLYLAIMPGDIALEHGVTYTVKCTVAMDSGLTAYDEKDITVIWDDADITPNAEMSYDNETYTMQIRPYCRDENDDLVEGCLLSVYRRNFDGSFTCLSDRINNNGAVTIIDPHPSLDYARYRIVAMSTSTGLIGFYDCPAYPIGEYAAIIQWDEQWQSFEGGEDGLVEEHPWTGSLVRLPYNMSIEDSHNVKKSLVEYIGRDHPVAYYGTQKGHTASWSFEEPVTDKEKLYAIRRLAAWRGNVYVREPNGTGYYASVDVSYSTSYNSLARPIKITVKQVDEGE